MRKRRENGRGREKRLCLNKILNVFCSLKPNYIYNKEKIYELSKKDI